MRPLWKTHRGKTTEGLLLVLVVPLLAVSDAGAEHGVDVTHHGGVVPPRQRGRLVPSQGEGMDSVVALMRPTVVLLLLLLL